MSTTMAGTAREGMTMSEWVDAPTGPGRWWRRVGDSEPVLCEFTDGEWMSAKRVDGLEVLYLATPFAGVKWRRDVSVSADETTRLRALLERAALPACEAGRDRGDNLCVYQTGRHQWTVAEVSESPDASDDAIEARAQLFAAIPTALPGLLDAAERAEREHIEAGESTRAAWRESERREQELRDRLIAAERERDDLAATLETRTAEHALAMARVRELEAIIAGRTTPPTDAEIAAHDGAWLVSGRGLALALSGQKAADCAYNARSAGAEWRWLPIADDGRPCAWPTAEVPR